MSRLIPLYRGKMSNAIIAPLSLNILHRYLLLIMNHLRLKLGRLVIAILSTVCLLRLLHLHRFSFCPSPLSNITWLVNCVCCIHVLAQFAFNTLESAHLPLGLLHVLGVLVDHFVALLLDLILNLMHLPQVISVIVLGHGFTCHWSQDTPHRR